MNKITLLFAKVFSLFAVVSLAITSFTWAQSTTYTSIASGAIDNPAIWSTDGGRTACNCIPVTVFPSFILIDQGSMEIKHDITVAKDAVMLGTNTYMNIFPTGTVTGTNSYLDLRSGTILNDGALSFSSLTLFTFTKMINRGQFTVTTGNLSLQPNAELNNSGDFIVTTGDVINYGTIIIGKYTETIVVGDEFINERFLRFEPGSCINVVGDFRNNYSIRTTFGYIRAWINVTGELTNTGNWTDEVQWCASGTAVGMTSRPSCNNPCNGSNGSGDRPIQRNAQPVSQIDSDGAYKQGETLNAGITPEVSAFPNPFQNKINLTLTGWENQTVRIVLSDLSGKVLQQETLTANHTSSTGAESWSTSRRHVHRNGQWKRSNPKTKINATIVYSQEQKNS